MSQLLQSRPGAHVRAAALVSLMEPDDETSALLADAGVAVSEHGRVENALDLEFDEDVLIVFAGAAGRDRGLPATAAQLCRTGRPVVVVCDRAGLAQTRALLDAGVGGVVIREYMHRTLLPTLIAVESGQVCVPQRYASAAERPALSIREKQVMGLVAIGLMNSEIAARLCLAESTVKSHLSSAFAKLGVSSRHEAVEMIVNPMSGIGLEAPSLDAEPARVATEPGSER